MSSTQELALKAERDGNSWVKIDVGQDAHISMKPVDAEVIAEMPSATKTFVERGLLDVLLRRLELLIHKGSVGTTNEDDT